MLALIASLSGCGTRGDPRPPVYPNPPSIVGLTAAQRGAFTILRFPAPDVFARVEAEDVEIEAVEVLVYAERYPVITTEMLIAGLERRTEVMAVDAAATAAAARARAAQLAAAEQAAAAGVEPPPPDPNAPPTSVTPRRPDQDFIYRTPPDILTAWEAQGLVPDAILQSAQRLVNSVDVLWQTLGLPNSMLDPDEPVLLPDAGTIAQAAQRLVARTDYERALPVTSFLARASVARRIPVEEFAEITVDEMLQVAMPVGTPSAAELRTRYFYAVRSDSTDETPGVVTALVGMAPAPVPVAPVDVTAMIAPSGVELTWTPPAGDLTLRRIDPETISYNVYRMEPGEVARAAPLNNAPLTEPSFTDTTMVWEENYDYEVRAMLSAAAAGGLRRESEGAKAEGVAIVDTYPPAPPLNVVANRAGTRVALNWTASPSIDIVGYRVYRHPFPAPDVPLRFNPNAPEDDPAATAPSAAGPPPSEPGDDNDNVMLAAGWELVTPSPVPFSRANDPDADEAVRYVYAVEAIDAAGNLSALAVGTENGDRDR